MSIHDVAPLTWPRCERLLAALSRVARVPVTLLVVPDYHHHGPGLPPQYRDALAGRLAAGDELALHGFFHIDEGPPPVSLGEWARRRLLTAAEGEFSSLTAAAARRRLDAGRAWFAAQAWPVHGFIAPAWLLGPGAWQAVAASPFAYTTTHRHLHLLHPWRPVAAPVFTWSTRSRTRRALSRACNGFGPVPRDAPLVRLALHPDDALHPAIVRQAQHLLEVLLRGRVAMTKFEFACTLRAQSRRWPRHTPHPAQPGGIASIDSSATPAPIATPASTSLG